MCTRTFTIHVPRVLRKRMDTALFGCGKAGRKWASILDAHDSIDTLYCVDPDSSQSDILTNLSQGQFYNLDVFDSDEFTPAQKAQYRSLTECDVWIVAIGYYMHERFVSLADQIGIDKVLVEKPLTGNPDRDFDDVDVDVAVNYVETIHPVLNAVIESARQDDAKITKAFHWRGKDRTDDVGVHGRRPYEHPAVKADLVHDISELYIGLQYLRQDCSLTLRSIEEVKRWNEVSDGNITIAPHFKDDAWTRLEYETDDGIFTIQGGFTDSVTRRFFLWIDEAKDRAYYGNTLSRSHTSPAAFVVDGEDAIETVQNALESGRIVTKADEQELFNSVDAEEIEFTKEKNTLEVVLNRLLDGEPLPTRYDAYQIERIAEQFYNESEVEYGAYY